MQKNGSELHKLVRSNLLRIVLVSLSIPGTIALLITYDRSRGTLWILFPTPTLIVGWAAALYGLFWIFWWFSWIAIDGGEKEIALYNVTWAPVTSDFVTNGPFEWLRYPLAFGYLEFLWGIGFLVRSTTAVIKVIPLMAIATIIYSRFVVDRRKVRKYGEAYRRYQESTPLMLPRIPDRAAILQLFKRRRRR